MICINLLNVLPQRWDVTVQYVGEKNFCVPYTCLCLYLPRRCVCAFLRVCMHTAHAFQKADCQMGIFQDQQNCENKWGPQKGPGTLFYCGAERLDSLSLLTLELI